MKNARTKKKLTISQWKKKLWPVFTAWIKERDGYQCFTCGKQMEKGSRDCQGGHFIPRSTCGLGLFFDEQNVHAQCSYCNKWLGGNGAVYYQKMVERYGQDAVDDIMWRKDHDITKDLPWEELWKRYKNHSKE